MALGNLFKKNEGGVEHFWSLVIGKTWVQAAIWRVVDESVEVVSEGSTASWQDGNEQSLVEAADGSLSAAAASIGDDVTEPNKVVFGLTPSWIQDGTIANERLGLLKKLSGELELSPAGFVVIPEAITHFLKTKEGAPLNAILVGLAEDSIDVTLVQNGKALGTVEVSQSISLGSDLAEGLSRLPQVSQYPSRILLYNHKVGNLEDARQNLLETNWQEVKVGFLHTPKVEILAEDIAVTSVSLAGGAEVGEAKRLVLPDKAEGEREDVVPAQDEVREEELTDLHENFPVASEVQEVSPEELGFLQGTDVAKVSPKPSFSVEKDDRVESYDIGVQEQSSVQERRKSRGTGVGALLGGLAGIFSGFKIPTFGLKGVGIFGVVGAVLIIALIVGGILYWYLPKANVTVYVAPKKLEKNLKLTIDPRLSVINQADKIIPGASSNMAVSGDKTASTTGEKIVGDRAKGQVTIYHIGGSTVLKNGSTLTGPGGLKFTLDNDVIVASSSGITNPSKTQASITAIDIGSQYNLASGSKFAVGNFSKDSFEAQNESAFSGGTSRSVSAVSEEDRANLEKDLTAELLSNGLEDLKNSLSPNEVLIEDSAKLSPDTKSFSNKVGEEASVLKLTISGKVQVVVASRESAESLVMGELTKDVPAGFTLRQDQVQITYKVEKAPVPKKTTAKQVTTEEPKIDTDKPLNLSAEIVANLLPKVDPEETARAITGKSVEVAREYLATIPGFIRAEISLSIKLPGKLGTLPRIAKNIIVEVAAER